MTNILEEMAIISPGVLLLSLAIVAGVDRSKFKSCDQSGFCKRLRSLPEEESSYKLLLDTVHATDYKVEALIENTKNNVRFRMELFGLQDSTFRLKINEAYPIKPRFEVPLALQGEPHLVPLKILSQAGNTLVNMAF